MQHVNEQSFILIKPDGKNRDDIILDIKKMIIDYNLEVLDKITTILDDIDVDYMWPKFNDDFVTNAMLKKYISGQVLPVYVLQGENCIEKTLNIKSSIRKKYATSDLILNCVHSPIDKEEYQHHYLHITKTKEIEKIPLKIAPLNDERFKRYQALDNERLLLCADNLWEDLKKIKIEDLKNKNENTSKYQLLMLIKNSDVRQITAALFEYFQEWEIERAYKTAFIVRNSGKFPIVSTDDLENVLKAYHFFNNLNIETHIKEK